MPSDDDSARRATRGTIERASVPGVPGLRLPPRPASSDPERTPPEPYVAKQRERAGIIPDLFPAPELESTPGRLEPAHRPRPQQTLVGPAAPPARGAAPAPPVVSTPVPRSASPVPSSYPVKIEAAGAKVEFRPHQFRKLLGWLFPAFLGAGGGVAGKAGHDAIADRARAAHDADQTAEIAALRSKLAEASTAAEMADAKANRAIGVAESADANANREVLLRTKLEERVDALGRQKAIIVKPSQ